MKINALPPSHHWFCFCLSALFAYGNLAAQGQRATAQSPLPYVVPMEQRVASSPGNAVYVTKIPLPKGAQNPQQGFALIQKRDPLAVLLRPETDGLWIKTDENGLESLAKARFYPRLISEVKLTGTQLEGLASTRALLGYTDLAKIDSDGDGLTDTEERWWGTDPYNFSTAGDGISDGEKIRRAMAGDHSAGLPWPDWPKWGQPMEANAWMTQGRGLTNLVIDLDMDCIPDAAERFILGTNPYKESTANDRYDDGQKFWGITQLGRGALPRAVDSDFLLAEMPNFVKPPGSSPFVTAYPKIDITIVGDSLRITTNALIHTEQRHVNESEYTYETETTQTQTSRALTVASRNDVTKLQTGSSIRPPEELNVQTLLAPSLTPQPLAQKTADSHISDYPTIFDTSAPQQTRQYWAIQSAFDPLFGDEACQQAAAAYSNARRKQNASQSVATTSGAVAGLAGVGLALLALPAGATLLVAGLGTVAGGGILVGESAQQSAGEAQGTLQDLQALSPDDLRRCRDVILGTLNLRPVQMPVNADLHTMVVNPAQNPTLWPQSALEPPFLHETLQDLKSAHLSSSTINLNQSSTIENIDSTTIHTLTNERMLTRTEWATATTLDTRHAADLTFNLQISNSGTDVARSLNSIIINIFLGDDKDVTYTTDLLGRQSSLGPIKNLFPGSVFQINTPLQIPLTFDQTKRIDLGEPIRIVIVRIEYGDDQLFYENAYSGGVLFLLDDGVDDGVEDLKPFLVPTWEQETYLQVISRLNDVLKLNFDGQTNLLSVDVPVFDTQHRITGFNRLANKDNASWLIFSQTNDGLDFSQKPAKPESTVLFKYLKDEDRDGFDDATELRLGTDPHDPTSFPKAELHAAFVDETNVDGNIYTTLIITNSGNWPATGVEAVMFSPDGSHNILKNFTGGGGIIQTNQKVIIGPRYVGPDLRSWSGDATPVVGGIYQGALEGVYTFSVSTGGNVGSAPNSPNIKANWGLGLDQSTNLVLGTNYSAPSLLAVGTNGLTVGFTSGFLKQGETFIIQAKPNADSFARAASANTNTGAPSIVLAWNTPRGHNRALVKAQLSSRTSDLSVDALTHGTSLTLSSLSVLQSSRPNPIHASILCAEDRLADARLYLELIDPSLTQSNVVWSTTVTNMLLKGINYINVPFDPSAGLVRSGPLTPGKVYYLLGTLTDKLIEITQTNTFGGNIIDQSMIAFAVSSADHQPNAVANWSATRVIGTNLNLGEPFSTALTVANTGTDTLEILLPITNSFIRTSIPSDNARLAPGQSLTFVVTVDTSTLSAANLTIPLFSNDRRGTNQPVQSIAIQLSLRSNQGAVTVLSTPGKPWVVDLLVPGPMQMTKILHFDMPSEWNMPGLFPITVSEAGEVIANGPYTSVNGKPWLAWNSTLRPRRVFFRLPADITQGAAKRYTFEFGLAQRMVNNHAEFLLPIPSANLDQFNLAVFPIQQRLEPCLISGKVNVSGRYVTAKSRVSFDFSDTVIKEHSETTGPIPNSNPSGAETSSVNFVDDLKETGVTNVTMIVSNSFSGGNRSATVFLSNIWSTALEPAQTNIVILDLDPLRGVCQCVVNSRTTNVTLTDQPWILGVESGSGTPSFITGSSDVTIQSLRVDGLELLGSTSRYSRFVLDTASDHADFYGSVVFKGVSTNGFPMRGFTFTAYGCTDTFYRPDRTTFSFTGDNFTSTNIDWTDFTLPSVDANFTVTLNHDSGLRAGPFNQKAIDMGQQHLFWTNRLSLTGSSNQTNLTLPVAIDAQIVNGELFALSGLSYTLAGAAPQIDLRAASVGFTNSPSPLGFPPGTTVTLFARVANYGNIPMQYFTVAFYDGDPGHGGTYLSSAWVTNAVAPLNGPTGKPGVQDVQADWVASAEPGLHTIFAVVDPYNGLGLVSTKKSMASTAPGSGLFIAYWSDISINCGTSSGLHPDVAYLSGLGYGYESGDAFNWPDGQTVRYGFNGEVVYRFNNVSSLYSYDLNLSLYRPDGLPVEHQVFANDQPLMVFVTDPNGGAAAEASTFQVNTNGHKSVVFATAYLPASLVSTGSIRVRISSVGGTPVSVSQIALHRGSRIFIDCGGIQSLATGAPADPPFPYTDSQSGIIYGYLSTNQSFAFGSGPSSLDTLRYSPSGTNSYKFSNLDPGNAYILRPTLKGPSNKYSLFLVNSQPVGGPFQLSDVPASYNLVISKSNFNTNGNSVVFSVVNADARGAPALGDSSIVDLELNVFTAAKQIQMSFIPNGLPDWWVLQYGAGALGLELQLADPAADYDHDGMSNWAEFIAGTDPTDPLSKLVIVATPFRPGDKSLNLSWNTRLGRVYTVEWAPNLNAQFKIVTGQEAIPADPSGRTTRLIEIPLDSPVFLRVRVARVGGL